ncbi:MAG: hypothetical protein WA705_16255 [Candidatus Ozemobacteraceae bacterium]
MQSFEILTVENAGIPVLAMKGYFEENAGEKLAQAAERFLQHGKTALVVDFGECLVINSLGVAALLDLTLRVVDDFKGHIIFARLDHLKNSVLTMAGVFPLAESAKDLEAAIKLAQKG